MKKKRIGKEFSRGLSIMKFRVVLKSGAEITVIADRLSFTPNNDGSLKSTTLKE